MQSKQNSGNLARTFGEIWNSLNQDERETLTLDLYNAKCCKTRQTIWKWANGKSQPSAPIIRDTVAKVVGKTVGSRVFAAHLFPR